MRKLIEMSQEYLLVCDNAVCDFKLVNETKEANTDIEKYINVACPDCGENLLTEEDYNNSKSMLKIINWMNRWFSWLTLLSPKDKKLSKATMKTHKGISIDVEK